VQSTKSLAGKGLRIFNYLMALVRKKFLINLMFNFFDTYVLSVLNYGCEVLGNIYLEDLERVHTKFCRWVLNDKQST